MQNNQSRTCGLKRAEVWSSGWGLDADRAGDTHVPLVPLGASVSPVRCAQPTVDGPGTTGDNQGHAWGHL